MFTVIVELHGATRHRLDEFLEGIRINARASLRDEPGCLRFDVHRAARTTRTGSSSTRSTPTRRPSTIGSPRRPHYAAWREVVSPLRVPTAATSTPSAHPRSPRTSRRTRPEPQRSGLSRWSRPSQSRVTTASAPARSLRVGTARTTIHSLAGLDIAALPYSLRVVLENLLRHEDGQPGHRRPGQAAPRLGPRRRPHAGARPQPVADVPARHQRRPGPRRPRRDAERHARPGRGPGDWSTRRSPPSWSSTTPSSPTCSGPRDAFARNVEIEYGRNAERYRFLKWGQQTLENFAVVPPGTGIMHQVNSSTSPGWSPPRTAGPSPTSAWAPTPTPRWSTASASSPGASAASRPRPSCSASHSRCCFPAWSGSACTAQLPEGATATDLVLDHHRDAAPPRRGREVRRVLRPRRRGHHAPGPAHHRQHEPRVRLDLRLLPDRRGDPALPAVHRPAGAHRRPRRGLRPAPGSLARPRPDAAATPSWSSSTSPPSCLDGRPPPTAGPRPAHGRTAGLPRRAARHPRPRPVPTTGSVHGSTRRPPSRSRPATRPPSTTTPPEPRPRRSEPRPRQALPGRPHQPVDVDAGRPDRTSSTTAPWPSPPSPPAPTPPTRR